MRRFVLVALLTAGSASTTSLAQGRLAVVVSAESIDGDQLYAAETRVLRAVEGLGGLDVVAREETKIHLQAMTELHGGSCAAAECLLNVGAVAGAGTLLYVKIREGHVDGEVLDLARQDRGASLSWSAPDGLTPPMVTRLVRSLLRPRAAGWLVLVGVPEGATVALDEENLPEHRAEGLAPGAHQLAITAEGFAPYNEVVEVEAGAVQTWDVVLRPLEVQSEARDEPAAWLIPSLLLGGGGAGVVVGVGLWGATWLFPAPAPVDRDVAMARDGTLRVAAVSAAALGAVLLTASGITIWTSSTDTGRLPE
ncbi:MAG: PEGA domain-containing protein [Myxococcota bacterium]